MESSNHHPHPPDGRYTVTDDFLEQIILDIPPPSYNNNSSLTVNDDVVVVGDTVPLTSAASNLDHFQYHLQQSQLFALYLSLDNGGGDGDDTGTAFDFKTDRELGNMRDMYPMFENLEPPVIHNVAPFHGHQPFLGQQTHTIAKAVNVVQPPAIRPRVRARRGQATDPHSIAERLRRERISEKIKALQELVPSCNKTDRAAMLDEILDYVKFLRLQVKVLSMSRLGGAGAVAQLVSDIPRSIEGENGLSTGVWESWSNEETEQEVAKLMDEDIGAAMQFLQTKSLCIMPVSLASLVYPTQHHHQQQDDPAFFKPEPPAFS